jgi:hypothetical protein
MELSLAPDPMRSVFSTRAAAGQSGRSSPRPLFALNEEAPPLAQLNWIGDIHMAPVFSGAKPDFLLTPKPDPKSGISEENPGRFPQEPGDMAAFRFQR